MESNIYDFFQMREYFKYPKSELLPNDVLIFKNGEKSILYEQYYWMILKLYDDELNHVYNDDYSIIEVLRPHYVRIYDKEKTLTKGK